MTDPNAETQKIENPSGKRIKQVTILFDDKGQGYDIKVFLPNGREAEIDIVDEEDVLAD